MKHVKKLLAVVLSMAMVIGCISVTAFGANTANKVLTSGGTYTLDGNWYGTTSSGTRTGIALTVNSGVTATVNRGSYQIYGKVSSYNTIINNGTLTLNHADSYVYNYSNADNAAIQNNGTLTLGTGTMVAQVTSSALTTPYTTGKGAIENNGTLSVNGAIVAGKITGTGTITKNITSGYFYDDLSDYCVDGYACIALSTAEKTSHKGCNYVVDEIDKSAASVTTNNTTKYYSTFADALKAALRNSNSKLTLHSDAAHLTLITLNYEGFVIDLNGHTLSLSNGIEVYGDLTIEDNSEDANGVIEYTGSIAEATQPFIAAKYLSTQGSGSVTLNSGTIRANGTKDYTDALFGAANGSATKVTINGGTIDTNGDKAYAAVDIRNGDATKNKITGGTIIGELQISGSGSYSINGGRFSEVPDSTYLQAGYQAIQKSDGYYHVMIPPISVAIDGAISSYSELSEAFSYINSLTNAVTATVTVSSDLEISSRIETTAYTEETIHNITLKLNDCTVTYTGSGTGAFLLRAYTYLTVEGNGTIDVTNSAFHFFTNQNSKLTINGGTFTNSSSATNKYVSSTSYPASTVLLDGGTFNYDPTSNADGNAYKKNGPAHDNGDGTYSIGSILFEGTVYTSFDKIMSLLENNDTITIIDDTVVSEPVQFNNAGGVASSVKNITITDDGSAHTISVGIADCTTNAAFVVGAGKTLSIKATAANNLHFKGYSGESGSQSNCNKPLITAASSGTIATTLNLTNIEFSGVNNSSKGGCVYSAGEYNVINVTGCNFHDNTAGGGSAIYSAHDLNVINSTFTNNSTTSNGTIYNSGGTLTIQNTTLTNNRAKLGAAIYNYGPASTFIFADTTITNNTSTGDGGAVYVNKNAIGTYGAAYIKGTNITIKNNKKKTQSTQEGSTAALAGVTSDLNVNTDTSIKIIGATTGEIGIDFDQAVEENKVFAISENYTPDKSSLGAFFNDEDEYLKAYYNSTSKELYWHFYNYQLTIGSSKTNVSGTLYSYKVNDVSVTQDIHQGACNIAVHVDSGKITVPWNKLVFDNIEEVNYIGTNGVGGTLTSAPASPADYKAISITVSDTLTDAEIINFIKSLTFTTAGNAAPQTIYAGIYPYDLEGFVYFAGGYYTYVDEEASWDNGYINAVDMGGRFPSILNQTENDIVSFIAGDNPTWIAAVKAYDAWYWKGGSSDGTQIAANANTYEGYNGAYANWSKTDSFVDSDYERAYMHGDGTWTSVDGLEEEKYVVVINDSIGFAGKQTFTLTKDSKNILTAFEPNFESDIAMTYYFTFSNEYVENTNSYVSIQVGSNEPIITNISELVASEGALTEGGYGITVKFAPKMLGEKVVIKVCDGAGAETTYGAGNGYNYLYYANQVMELVETGEGDIYSDVYSVDHVNMVKTLLHYGAAAQVQFDYNAEDLVNKDLESPGIVDPTAINEDNCVYSQSAGEIFTKAALTSDSMTGMRVYFTGSATTADVNGVEYAVQNDGQNYVEFPIAAMDLARVYTVIVGDESININAYYVINTIVNDGDASAEAKETAFRLFELGEAAATFFGTYAPSVSISEALLNLAYAYYANGANVQYDQKKFTEYTVAGAMYNTSRRQINVLPEEITELKSAFVDCSSFIQNVVVGAVGTENGFRSMGYVDKETGATVIDEQGFTTYDLAEDKTYAFAPIREGTNEIFQTGLQGELCRWGRTTKNEPTLAARAEEMGKTMDDLYAALRYNLQPGDIVVKYRAYQESTNTAAHGHVILWTGDGYIHCTGSSYDYSSNSENTEDYGSIFYVPASKFEEEFDLATFTKVVIYRPSSNMTTDMLTDYGIARQQLGPMDVEITANTITISGTKKTVKNYYEGISVAPNASMNINIKLSNDILTGALGASRTVDLTYTLPDGVTLVDEAGASVSGNTLSWKNVTVGRGETVTKQVQVTVNASGFTQDVYGRDVITKNSDTGAGYATIKVSAAGNSAKEITFTMTDIYVDNVTYTQKNTLARTIERVAAGTQTVVGSGIEKVNGVLNDAGVESDFMTTYTTDAAVYSLGFVTKNFRDSTATYEQINTGSTNKYLSQNFMGGRRLICYYTSSNKLCSYDNRVRNIEAKNLKSGDIIAGMKDGEYTYYMYSEDSQYMLKIQGETASQVAVTKVLDELMGAFDAWQILTVLGRD